MLLIYLIKLKLIKQKYSDYIFSIFLYFFVSFSCKNNLYVVKVNNLAHFTFLTPGSGQFDIRF